MRSFVGVFASWKFQERLGPNQFGSCIENFAAIEGGTKVIPEVFQHSESISTAHFLVEAFSSLFSFREAFRATRAISVLELFGGYVHPFLVIQKPMSTIFNLMSLMEKFLEPIEVIFTSKFSMQVKRAIRANWGKYCIRYNFTV